MKWVEKGKRKYDNRKLFKMVKNLMLCFIYCWKERNCRVEKDIIFKTNSKGLRYENIYY